MNAMTEIVIGLGIMLESAFHAVRIYLLKSVFLFVALLLIGHYLTAKAERGKILILVKSLILVIIVLTCISGFIYYYQKTLYAYAFAVPNMEPVDLKCNYYGALESRLYDSTLGGESEWLTGMPAVFTPPVFAFMRLSTLMLGDDFDQYAGNYRMCGLVAAAMILLMLVSFTLKRLGRRSVREIVLISFSINTFLFLLLLFVIDIRIGNTNTFVGFLVAAQLLMTFWKHHLSKFIQAFILVLAWWIKPNMILVIWCLTVFSLSRKEYPYLIGLFFGFVAPIVVSLFAANISLETYVTYFAQVSKVIERAALDHTSNLSIFCLVSNPVLAYKIALLLGALLVLLYTTKIKGEDFIKFEMFCFMITYMFWPRVWPYYFIPLALITWVHIINRIGEGNQIYFELLLILALSMSIALLSIIWVNVLLAASAIVYWGWHVSSSRRQMVVSHRNVNKVGAGL